MCEYGQWQIHYKHFQFSGERQRDADHISIFYSSLSLLDIEQTPNSELNDLKQWLQGNKLPLNVLTTLAPTKIKEISERTFDHS